MNLNKSKGWLLKLGTISIGRKSHFILQEAIFKLGQIFQENDDCVERGHDHYLRTL